MSHKTQTHRKELTGAKGYLIAMYQKQERKSWTYMR